MTSLVRRSVVLLAFTMLSACGGPPDPRVETTLALTGDATSGEALFTSQKCTDCHGKAGRGGFGVDLGSDDVHTTPKDELANTVLVGRLFMPAFKAKVTDQELADLLAFIDTLGR
jgi:mono/diheme cytochrome c family protein